MLRDKSYDPAKKEVATLEKYAADHGFADPLEQYDIIFYSKKYAEEKYGIKGDQLR